MARLIEPGRDRAYRAEIAVVDVFASVQRPPTHSAETFWQAPDASTQGGAGLQTGVLAATSCRYWA